MSSTVSIIMPVYNSASFLEETLMSVEKQTYSNWELILIDDGSDDNSIEIVKQFCNKHLTKTALLFSNYPQSGPAACRNIGIDKCRGKYVIFLDSDDLLEPFCLQQRVTIMEQKKTLSWAIFKQYIWHNHKTKPYAIFNKITNSREQAIGYFLSMNPPWSVTCPIWTKTFLQQLNGFDDTFKFMEDPDLHLRALLYPETGYLICDNRPPDSFYRIGNMNSAKEITFYRNSILYRLKFLDKYIADSKKYSLVIKNYHTNIRSGFILLLKKFVLSRIDLYYLIIKYYIELLSEKKILLKSDKLIFTIVIALYKNNNWFIKIFRLKGILNKLLL